MKLIAKITDKDIGMDIVDYENPQIRRAARGIVLNENGEIALLHKKIKMSINYLVAEWKETKQKKWLFKEKF